MYLLCRVLLKISFAQSSHHLHTLVLINLPRLYSIHNKWCFLLFNVNLSNFLRQESKNRQNCRYVSSPKHISCQWYTHSADFMTFKNNPTVSIKNKVKGTCIIIIIKIVVAPFQEFYCIINNKTAINLQTETRQRHKKSSKNTLWPTFRTK